MHDLMHDLEVSSDSDILLRRAKAVRRRNESRFAFRWRLYVICEDIFFWISQSFWVSDVLYISPFERLLLLDRHPVTRYG